MSAENYIFRAAISCDLQNDTVLTLDAKNVPQMIQGYYCFSSFLVICVAKVLDDSLFYPSSAPSFLRLQWFKKKQESSWTYNLHREGGRQDNSNSSHQSNSSGATFNCSSVLPMWLQRVNNELVVHDPSINHLCPSFLQLPWHPQEDWQQSTAVKSNK